MLKLAADNADGVQDIKGAIAAIHFMVTNAAKYDVEDNVFVQEIQQLGLPKENTDMIAKQLRETKDHLRAKFAEDSYRISRLLSTDWRVDMVLGSSSRPAETAEKEKIIHLNMHIDNRPGDVDSPDKHRNLAFEVSSTKLDGLVHELSQVLHMMQSLDS